MIPHRCKTSVAAWLMLAALAPALVQVATAAEPAPVQPVLIEPVLSVSPSQTAAGEAFTLRLLGVPSDCHTVFSRESVTVSEKRIHLSYLMNSAVTTLDSVVTDVKPASSSCPVYLWSEAGILPPLEPAPAFKVPALKAGSYEVFATQMQECMYGEPACKMAAIAVSAGTLIVTPEGGISYSIAPTSVAADQEFEISLLSYQFNCGTQFDNLSTAVVGNVITLSYLDHEQIGIACPAIYKPYGPTFKLKGLQAGAYKVAAYRHPACLPCKMLGATSEVGTLMVTGTDAKKGWYLKEKVVPPDNGFTLQLLKNDLGNCQTSFSHKTLASESGGIHVSFLVENHPERVCIQNVSPHGPSFEVKALKAGVYPIHVTELLECEVTAPYCAVDLVAPQASDSLIVAYTVSTLLSDLRAKAPRAEMTGSRAAFLLPEGMGGTWKTELVNLSGQRLFSRTLRGKGGTLAELELGKDLRTGVYLLRLQAPDGETHLLPIVRGR